MLSADDDEEATAIDENFDDYDRESSVLTTGGGDCGGGGCDNDELFFQRSPQLRRRDDGGCCDVSSRYDTCIVYALDECLTRGTYRLFAQWLCRYLTRENLPGCLTIVGFSKRRRRGVEDDCYPVGRDTVNLGPRRNRDDYDGNGGSAGGNEIPYIRLNPNDRYAIFDFKRQTGYPTIVLLVTLPSSRMEHCLSCDGAILVHARHTLRRNMIDVADVLRHLNRDYLEDLYTRINADRNYDNDEECCVTDEATAGECTINGGGTGGGCLIGFERRRDGEVAAIDEPPPSRFDGGASVAAVDDDDDHPVAPFSSTQQWWSGGGGGGGDDGGNVISWIHQPPRQPVVECADENWEDRRFGKERIEISEQGDRISPPRLITAAARNGSTFEHTENAAVAKLNIHNRTLLNDLKRMDATLTNTHSIDRLPVIHGESIDVYS